MKKKFVYFSICILTLSFLVFLFPRFSLAAKFSVSPTTREVKVGEEFQVDISLDTQGKAVNGAQAKLTYPSGLLELKRVDFSDIFPSNFQQIKNASGYVQLASGEDLPSANFNGHLRWLTLTFETKVEGNPELKFACLDSAILEYETTSNLLDCSGLNVGNYTVVVNDPEPTSSPDDDGENGDNGDDGNNDEGCTDASPEVPSGLQSSGGPNLGEVTLTWDKTSNADHYSLVFGNKSRQYQYGAANIGAGNRYVVKQLAPGQLYYFAVAAVRGCASSGFSAESSARSKMPAGGGLAISTPTVRDTIIPTPTLPYQPIGQVLPNVDFGDEVEPTPIPMPEIVDDQEPILSIRNILLLVMIVFILIGVVLLIRTMKKRPPSKGATRYVDLSKPDSTLQPPSSGSSEV